MNDLPVGAVGNTGEGVVPCEERSHETKSTASNDATALRVRAIMLKVSNTEEQEGQVEGEEEREECDCRPKRAEQEEKGENEPSHQVQAERVEERRLAKLNKRGLDSKTTRSENDGK